MSGVSSTRDASFAELVEGLGKAKNQAENSGAESVKTRLLQSAATGAIDDGHAANENELEARAAALATGDDRADQPLVDIVALEAKAEVARRLFVKLEAIKKRDDEAFTAANKAVATARTALARRHCDEAGFGWQMDEGGDQRPRKLAWVPETTLGALAAMWAAHGISNGDRGPKGSFAQFIGDWLSEPSQDHRETARQSARIAAAID